MGWLPGPRPEWVRAVNDGRVPLIAEVAELPFERDRLLAEARATMGIAQPTPGGRHSDAAGGGPVDFGDEAFLEPLDLLVDGLEKEADLTLAGRWLTRRFLLRLLEVRLQIVGYLRADPGVAEEQIRSPLFVTGVPRTGTTILHALLAQDPTSRVPEGWELLRPVPPPEPSARDADARIGLADRELRLPSLVASGLDAIHEYGGRMPKECLSAMSFEFCSEEFTVRYHLPTYASWLARCDMGRAYRFHRLVLQILQRRYSDVRWVLKSPVHLHSLPTLLDVYPDARLAITHRDPLKVLPSVTSLYATLRWVHSDNVDFGEIGRQCEALYRADLDRLVIMCEGAVLDSARVHHVHYGRLLSDPVAVIGRLYECFGRPMTDQTMGRMRDYLASRPKDKHGPHHYSFDDLGLTREHEVARFARYRECFDVPSES